MRNLYRVVAVALPLVAAGPPPSGGHPIPHPHPSACLDSVVPQAPSHAWCQTRSGKLSGRTIQGYHMAVARKPRKALPVSPALVLVGGRHNTRLGGRHSNQITFNSIPLEKFSKLIGIVDPSQSKDQLNPLGSDIRGKGENPWVSEGKKGDSREKHSHEVDGRCVTLGRDLIY